MVVVSVEVVVVLVVGANVVVVVVVLVVVRRVDVVVDMVVVDEVVVVSLRFRRCSSRFLGFPRNSRNSPKTSAIFSEDMKSGGVG